MLLEREECILLDIETQTDYLTHDKATATAQPTKLKMQNYVAELAIRASKKRAVLSNQ